MAEQSTPQKSSDEVKVSPARAEAESSSRSSHSSGGAKTDKPKSKGDGERAHPMQGRSLEYTSGPGAEAYEDGQYETDRVLDLPHFAHHKR